MALRRREAVDGPPRAEKLFAPAKPGPAPSANILGALHRAAPGSAATSPGAPMTPAKLLAMTAIDLLYDKAPSAAAKEIIGEFRPAMTKDSYLTFARGLFKQERWSGLEIERNRIHFDIKI